MAALFESGFFVGEAPWHGLGEIVPEDTRYSASEGLIAAGMNWDVYTRPAGMYRPDGWTIPMEEVCDKKGVKTGERPANVYTCRRMLVNGQEEEQILSKKPVGGGYEVFQNHQIFSWFQPYLDTNQAYLHTAGSLNDGRWVWCLAKINRPATEILPNDWVEKFLLLSSSHDGTLAVRIGFTPIRVVCANTLALAHHDKRSKLLRLKHTKMLNASLEEVQDLVNLMDAGFEATAEQFRFLASKGVNKADLEKYVVRVLSDGAKENRADCAPRMTHIVDTVIARMDSEANSLPGIKGTWYAAYNAITEHLTWAAGGEGGDKSTPKIKANNRLASLWFGKNEKANNTALELAVEMAAA